VLYYFSRVVKNFKKPEVYCLLGLDPRSMKSKYQQDHAVLTDEELGGSFFASCSFWCQWTVLAFLGIAVSFQLHGCLLLHVSSHHLPSASISAQISLLFMKNWFIRLGLTPVNSF
jgi:hypothetical protein